MRTLLLLTITLVSVASAQTAPPATAADRAAGRAIFRAHCASCHGVNGTGDLGPDLTTGVFFHGDTDADLYRNITQGIDGTAMPSTIFEGPQIWQVVAYVRSLSQGSASLPVRGDPAHGRQLLHEKGCIGCHLVRGEGGVAGPDLSVIGSQRSPDYLRESIVDPNAKVSPHYWTAHILMNDGSSYAGFVMDEDTYIVQILDLSKGLVSLPRSSLKSYDIDHNSSMPSYKDSLSASELDDIVSYLASLKRQIRGTN